MKRFFLLTIICICFVHLNATESQTKNLTDTQGASKEDLLYLVIDLSEGAKATSYPVSYLPSIPTGGWTDEYKTNKLVLRRIEAGSFMMGSPDDELGRWNPDFSNLKFEFFHQVTLTKSYYMGVFEVTQKQWSLVMGSDPSEFKGDARPVEHVSFEDIRGSDLGLQWPVSAEVDATSFMGKLRVKTMLDFDLPTEAQWEYACRAGTTTALNSGKNLTNIEKCTNMAEVGRYKFNQSDGKGGYSSNHTTVGSYLPNAWGLYDMHGNIKEWCLDWIGGSHGTQFATDPVGPVRVYPKRGKAWWFLSRRGGSWRNSARSSRSADQGVSTFKDASTSVAGLRVIVRIEL